MSKRVCWLALACAMALSVCGVGCGDTLDGYPHVVFPLEGDKVWEHKEGSMYHTYSGLTVQDGMKASDLFALDLPAPSGTPVRSIASGEVVWIATSYGYVIVKHTTPITTDSDFINKYVQGKVWYSGYMHMKNIAVSMNQTVDTTTKLGEVSNVHPTATLGDHLHFAVYDKDMYSFSPYLLGDAFREGHVTYHYDYTGRGDFESDKTVNAACLHYWAAEEEKLGRELTEEELHANIKAKYTGTSTEVWHFSTYYPNYRNNASTTEGGDLDINGEPLSLEGYYETTGEGHYANKIEQTDEPVSDGVLRIVGEKESSKADWLRVSGTINFKQAAYLTLAPEILTWNKKDIGFDGGHTLREWDVNNPTHIHLHSGRPIYYARDAHYYVTQIDSETIELRVIYKYSDLAVKLKKKSSIIVSAADSRKDASASRFAGFSSGSRAVGQNKASIQNDTAQNP